MLYTIPELLTKRPHAIDAKAAVVDGTRRISYAELTERAIQHQDRGEVSLQRRVHHDQRHQPRHPDLPGAGLKECLFRRPH